jgi:hypothetical protein
MNSSSDIDPTDSIEEDLAVAKLHAKQSFKLAVRKATYSAATLALGCALVVLFSKGHSLHAHAETYGRILVYCAMVLFVIWGACTGLAISSWIFFRDVRSIELE